MRIRSLSLSLLIVTLSLSTFAHAEAPSQIREKNLEQFNIDQSNPDFIIKKMVVRELSDEEFLALDLDEDRNGSDVNIPYPCMKVNDLSSFNSVIEAIDKIVAIGEKVVPLIEKGRAVVKSKNMSSISVIPNFSKNDSTLGLLSGWSLPVTKHYQVNFKNFYGINVVNFVYSVSYQYGGNHYGKGKYLTGVRVAVRNVKVLWGFDVDAHSELLQISNVGTQANVIAGATIEMNYTVGNFANVISTSESFHVTGDGRLYKLD